MGKKRISRLLCMTLLVVMMFTASSFATEASEERQFDDISAYENAFSSDAELFEDVLGLSEGQIMKLYDDFIIYNMRQKDRISVTENSLEAFAEYAVSQGVIEDTPEQREAITKSLVRASLSMAASDAETIGLTTASACLRHSLQDNPVDVSIQSDDPISAQVKKSAACKTIISNFKNKAKNQSASSLKISGSTTLNNSLDLTLAFNRVSYVASGTKNSNGKWTLKITFKDTYDFDNAKWTDVNGLKAQTINLLNSYGKYAESVGAVVTYDIKVIVKTTFTE